MHDRQAEFQRVYDTYGVTLYRICAAHIGVSDAEDVLQEAFIRYLKQETPFSDAEHERRWLIRVCVNLCRSRYASARRQSFDKPNERIPAPDAYGERDVLDAVQRLPPKLRSVIVLHCCEGYTLEETAALLKIGLSAAKMRLSRARDKLKLELDAPVINRKEELFYEAK
ncbi:MAG: RNA polymerase sigma factor [Oscillospiraceae bacterium]|jgi:RNA polymerase sigma-70 factor (ECF subfamily)|nr:RNA polymerase sigma factor [Oscillospiraceae bacterium]